MISFGGIILLITAIYCGIKLVTFYIRTSSSYYLCLFLATFSLVAGVTGYEIQYYLSGFPDQRILDWSQMISISFVMCGLAILIWTIKPGFARYPYVFCGLPLLLIGAFSFVIDSHTLKQLILAMLQGGAIVIGYMLYLLNTRNNPSSYYVVAGLSVLLVSYIINLIPNNTIIIPTGVIYIILSFGKLLIIQGLSKLIINYNAAAQQAI